MDRTLSKKSAAYIMAIALLVALLFDYATTAWRPFLVQHSAVLSGDRAALRAMPSRFTDTIGDCSRGQRLTVWTPLIFDYFRARCNGVDGFIAREFVRVSEEAAA